MSRRVVLIHSLPNFITSGNLFSGFYAILAISQEKYEIACFAIFIAAVFDLLDGRVARMTKSDSKFGLEYDSLCDLVSFGIAPAFLMYQLFLSPFKNIGFLAAFLIVLCSALRLARFNLLSGHSPKSYFVGLPVPMSAATLIGFYLFFKDHNDILYLKPFALGICFTVGALMVSTFRFASFKDFHPRRRTSIQFFVPIIVALCFIVLHPYHTLFFVMSLYIGVCILLDLIRIWRRKKVK